MTQKELIFLVWLTGFCAGVAIIGVGCAYRLSNTLPAEIPMASLLSIGDYPQCRSIESIDTFEGICYSEEIHRFVKFSGNNQ